MTDLRTRPASGADASAIAAIYNEGIADRIATFETELRSATDIAGWFTGEHLVVVAETRGNGPCRVRGLVSLQQPALAPSVRGRNPAAGWLSSSAESAGQGAIMSVRLGISPIGWCDDDLPELGGDIPLDTCLAELIPA